MQVKQGDTVKAFVEAKTNNGKVLYSNIGKGPVEIRVTQDCFLKGLEKVVEGMQVGEEKEISLSQEQTPPKVIPRGYHESKKKVGDEMVYFNYKENTTMKGTVIRVEPKLLVVDFNNQQRANEVKYKVKVVDISGRDLGQTANRGGTS